MKAARNPWALLVLFWLAGAAMADNESERALLRQQRAQIEARFEATMHECAGKFQVTDCELAAKAQRRAALGPVLKREQAIDLAVRQQQAQERRERVADKQRAQAQEARARAHAAQTAGAASAPRIAPSAAKREVATPRLLDHDKAMAVRSEEAARQASQTRVATEQRIEKARQHESEVRAREADLVAQGKRAAPLPMPGASAVLAPASAAAR